jgi:polysaccharide export outer membrane protein
VIVGLLLLCLSYCLVAPNQYEASAKVALRQAPATPLSLEAAEPTAAASFLSAPLQLETLATVFRSDRLAWGVITDLKLYQAPGFISGFDHRFPGFKPDAPSVDAQAYLIERFEKKLRVQTVPRTLLIQIRFRSKDAALSASVVNDLIRAYGQQESESSLQATMQASDWLGSQLKDLKARVESDRQRLASYQSQHGILSTPEIQAGGQSGETEHSSVLLEIDELGRQLVAATTDRILREAEYRAAQQGDPELVLASDPGLQAQGASFPTGVLQQIHARHSDLEQEQAQLSLDHGPNCPRVVELRRLLQDLDQQKQVEDTKLVARFESAWKTAADREQLAQANLAERTREAMKLNQAAAEYEVMRQEANSSQEVYVRLQQKVEEAGLLAGIHASSISVVDLARQPAHPVSPDPVLYMAITLFVSLWLAVGGALLLESLRPSVARTALMLLAVVLVGAVAQAQAPTPSTSGLPSGVAHLPPTPQPQNPPSAQDSATTRESAGNANQFGPSQTAASSPMPAPIGPGDTLDISEFRTPEFHSQVRVSSSGTVTLPMIHEVQIGGMDEQGAARAIEEAFVARGMLLHPQVSVLVTAWAGQDVSVLGEVGRPGVYPYTLHHRLLDLISAASGVAPNAGRLVNIYHRNDSMAAHPVVLDPNGADTGVDHNPELLPGDTVQVSRAGLVYVVGDVVRPGGFAVDPAQGLTVVQALTLAWGPSQNAALGKAILIREQKGGRTLTTLNLKRLLHGLEPDQAIRDRDILYVPDSTAKNLWNKSLESAIQSAVGVTIYAGLVYSQRS